MKYKQKWKSTFLFIIVFLSILPHAEASSFRFSGKGWGHGVGLSQYGAKALGDDGASSDQILYRYFPLNEVHPISSTRTEAFFIEEEKPFWVGLKQNLTNLAFTLEENASLCFDDNNYCFPASIGSTWRFTRDAENNCVFYNESQRKNAFISLPGSCNGSVKPESGEKGFSVPVKARTYREGILRFRDDYSGSFNLILQTDLEGYSLGLAPMPDSWSFETLKAQAVVSRSLAVATVAQIGPAESFNLDRKQLCFCNIRDDDVNQIFRGATSEQSHPRWVKAVEATNGLVLTYEMVPSMAMFSSSSGGNTESYAAGFGSDAHPYLVSVNDHASFSVSAGNPHLSWGATYSHSRIAGDFGFSWVNNLKVISRNDSGSAREVEIHGIVNGKPEIKTVDARDFRNKLSLRSTSFDIEVTSTFSDVRESHSFAGEILGLYDLGITKGCSSFNFCPSEPLTRAEMAAFINRAFALPVPSGVNSFDDDEESVFEQEIEALKASGITSGCAERSFCPNRTVTRAEMAAFLTRAKELEKSSDDFFVDDDNHFLENEINALAKSGITSGCAERSFCPNRKVTRAEMAAFLIRAIDR